MIKVKNDDINTMINDYCVLDCWKCPISRICTALSDRKVEKNQLYYNELLEDCLTPNDKDKKLLAEIKRAILQEKKTTDKLEKYGLNEYIIGLMKAYEITHGIKIRTDSDGYTYEYHTMFPIF